MLITLTDAFGTAEEEVGRGSCFSSALIDSLLKLRLLSLNFETKKHPTFQLGVFCSCVCFCASALIGLCCFSLSDNEYGNRYARSESNKANDNPNPSVRRIARRNRESGGGVTAGRANGQCVPALRKCLKIACFQLNDDTALLPFIIFGGDGLSVHKQLDKVGECRVGAESQSVFIAFPPLTVRSVKNRRRKLLCNGVLGADLLLSVCVGEKPSAGGTTPVRNRSRACRRSRYRINRFYSDMMICVRFAVLFMRSLLPPITRETERC